MRKTASKFKPFGLPIALNDPLQLNDAPKYCHEFHVFTVQFLLVNKWEI